MRSFLARVRGKYRRRVWRPSARPRGDACDRAGGSGGAGSYRREGLIQRFSADAALPDVLMALASCERRADFSRPCGVRFTDLAARP